MISKQLFTAPLLLILLPLLISCSSDEYSENEQQQLMDCKIRFLVFEDDIRFTDSNFMFHQLDSIKFNYQGNTISKVIGGFQIYDPHTSFNNKLLSNQVYDSIVVSANTYKVYTFPNIGYYLTDNPSNPVKYVINNDHIQEIIRRDGLVLHYEYEGDLILEKDDNGLVLRKFYMDNNNLVKVEKFKYDMDLEIYDKTEIIFEDFDSNPNFFKGKPYLLGAFYRSFSHNNYLSYKTYSYTRLDNGDFQLYNTFEFSTTLEYQNELPLFGNYN